MNTAMANHEFMEEPLRYEAITGLSSGQLAALAAQVAGITGGVAEPGGRPAAIGLYRSVALVVALMRSNLTQERAGEVFGVSQATVSRRRDLIRPAIGQALAQFVPRPAEVAGQGTVLVDGTIAPAWNWKAIPDLYSGKAGYPGINIQVAATLDGDLAAIGPIPVPGARHDAHAFAASGLKDLPAGQQAAADLGYTGMKGITIVPFRTPPGGKLAESQAAFNTALSKIRAAVEHAIAHLKTWRMLSEEGGRYRPPISNTRKRSKQSSDLSSLPLMNKAPGLKRSSMVGVTEGCEVEPGAGEEAIEEAGPVLHPLERVLTRASAR